MMSQYSRVGSSETPRPTGVYVILLLLFTVILSGFWFMWTTISDLSRRVVALENYQRAREVQPQISDLFYQKGEIDNFINIMTEREETASSAINSLRERMKAAEKKLDGVKDKNKP
jgi:hypothetical protein